MSVVIPKKRYEILEPVVLEYYWKAYRVKFHKKLSEFEILYLWDQIQKLRYSLERESVHRPDLKRFL